MSKKISSILLFGILYLAVHLFGIASYSLQNIIFTLGGGILMGVLVSWIIGQTKLKKGSLIIFLLSIFFVVAKFINIAEGLFYSSFESLSALTFFSAFMVSLVEAVSATVIFGKREFQNSIIVMISEYFHSRNLLSWIWRIILSSMVYLPVYFLFGAMASPFVMPYYRNPVYGLTIPPFSVIIPLEIVRGFLYTIAFLPFFAVLRKNFKRTASIVIFVLLIPGALIPFFSAINKLPLGIAPYHTVELLADSVIYGFILTKLLFIKK